MHNHGHQSYGSSSYSTSSHPSFRDSDSTQGTSQSTLFPPPTPTPSLTPTPSNGGPVEAANNVINKRADKETSLFQICLNLRQRLRGVPDFEQSMLEEEMIADEGVDPVTLLWRTFRQGFPLLKIYNALNPRIPLAVDPKVPEKKRGQTATYKFIQGCLTELRFPSDECFILTDLYGDDTTGFVKVAKVVNRVLDILVQAGLLSAQVENQDASLENGIGGGKRTQREHIIEELVKTERTYVQHLELLQAFKKLVEEKGVITGDAVHDIFLNLNALLDFQRRFLIRVEQINSEPESNQNWGKLFILYRDAFKVYEPYIANQKKCEEVAMREFDKLKETGGPLELRQMAETPANLISFLLKPFQRLTKYPLLLKQLRDRGGLDEERKADISTGIEAASEVLERTNAAVDREERQAAVEELGGRVEDWKGHKIEGFGDLLLHGTFTVLKGDTKDQEREYRIYLFEMILLCCKEMNPNKQKNKLMNKPLVDKRGKPKLQLKGRIFMQNVTDLISFGKPGSYTCQIFWKGDPGIENFVIRFTTEETMKKWAHQVDLQRRLFKDIARTSNGTTKASSTSTTEFTYMRGQEPIENPYRQEDEGEDDDDDTLVDGYPGGVHYASTQNGSSASLRSRSATNDSGPLAMPQSDPRAPPPRFPMGFTGQPALTLRTQQLQQNGHTPGDAQMDSYFSPGVDSPTSSRTSSSSGMFPFPRQPAPTNGWHGEEHARYTAPAMARNVSRDGSTYPINGRNPMQRPAIPAPNSFQQNRLRSASSPDIQNSLRRMQTGPQPPVPDLPPFPTHYAYAPNISSINRSQNNSPGIPTSLPTRAATQSPAIQRERLMLQRGATEHPDMYQVGDSHHPRHGPMPRTLTPASSLEHARAMTPGPIEPRTISPPLSITPRPAEEVQIPSQLKVKVHCPSAGSTMTLVVSTNISYQSLKDRIDAKLQRSTKVSLSSGQVKLKYNDDGDFVNIQSDEDVQTAFETWKEQQKDQIVAGSMGEIELYCQR
ncbi:hypothetical protein W97_06294 [Coniosporium apollinis CBS 100218]|uniref:DH domain-containing protein n=1 Tax=Coniosporium apollinis (strain CBS 100218) TaxID=1168221 RepID=R7YYY5_CONA1|nr:uncharacterized protein W97_06294 [Coniosporium apollinis CBS 100218]EON66891.1 hypothetical protein W97_06294 [Coniosporium apollinis CBS 100218]